MSDSSQNMKIDLNLQKCPLSNKNTQNLDNIQDSEPLTGCPVDFSNSPQTKTSSGCPFSNNIRKEIKTNFSFYFDLPLYHKTDFYFEIGGQMPDKDFESQTKKLKEMPRHLKTTLFHTNEEKILKIRKKDFTTVYFIYEELKEKAMNFYLEKDYRQCISYLTFAYSSFKWLEFKDSERNKNWLDKESKLAPILDDDVIERRVKTDLSISFEEQTYKGCLVLILKFMSFAYMHLRNFNEAIKCLNEAILYSDDKVAELYFRRSQARFYNRYSNYEKLNMAVHDACKAIEIDGEEERFKQHLQLLTCYAEEKKLNEKDRMFTLINNAKYAFEKIKEKQLDIENNVYYSYKEIENYFEILKEMKKSYKYAIKFHTDTNNKTQVKIALKEYELFLDAYVRFKWYYFFDINKLLLSKSNEVDPLQTEKYYIFNLI